MRQTFANLPGQIFDRSPRIFRKEVASSGKCPHDILEDITYIDSDGVVDEDKRITEAYGLASLVIEQQWKEMKTRTPEEGIPVVEHKDATTIFKLFGASMLDFIEKDKYAFFEAARLRFLNKEAPMTKDDAVLARYINARTEGENIGLPSMKDLATLLERVSGMLPDLYQREFGRPPTKEEIVYAVSHPTLTHFFIEIMTNNRYFTFPLLGRFEGTRHAPDLDDLKPIFDSECFTLVADESGRYVVQPTEHIASWFTTFMTHVAKIRETEGKEPLIARQCPVLYTGLFREMHEWMAKELDVFLTRDGRFK
jgi:hypothetical protein